MWVRAVWLEGDVEEEGVIPKTWLSKGTVFWPPRNTTARAMRERQKPAEDWMSFKLVKVKFSAASKAACEAHDQTTTVELSEDDDIPSGKRKTKKRAYDDYLMDSPEEFEEDSSTCIYSRATLPRPPSRMGKSSSSGQETVKTQRRPSSGGKHFPSHNPSSLRHRSPSPHPLSSDENSPRHSPVHWPSSHQNHSPANQHQRSSSQCPSTSSHISKSPSELGGRPSFSPDQSTPSTSHGSSSLRSTRDTSSAFPMTEGKFQKKVLLLLTEIRDTVASLGKVYEPPESTFHIATIKTVKELQATKKILEDSQKCNLLISQLSRIGGVNGKDTVNKIMHRIMTNEVMSSLNMKGNGGKIAFCESVLFRVVKESALKNLPGTETEVCGFISRCLKYAPDRCGGGGRKK